MANAMQLFLINFWNVKARDCIVFPSLPCIFFIIIGVKLSKIARKQTQITLISNEWIIIIIIIIILTQVFTYAVGDDDDVNTVGDDDVVYTIGDDDNDDDVNTVGDDGVVYTVGDDDDDDDDEDNYYDAYTVSDDEYYDAYTISDDDEDDYYDAYTVSDDND